MSPNAVLRECISVGGEDVNGEQKYEKFEKMSIAELRDFLRDDVSAAEQVDMDTLLYVSHLLAEREQAAGVQPPDVSAAKAEFMEKYYPLVGEEKSLYEFEGDETMAECLTSSQAVRRVSREKHGVFRGLKMAAVAAVLAVMLVGGTIAISPETPAIAGNMLARLYDEYLSIHFVSDNQDAELPLIEIGYMPSGYVMIENKNMVGNQHKRLKYENDDGNRLSISVWVAYKGLNYNTESEHRELTYVTLASGVEGHLLLADEPQYSSSLLWVSADGRLFFTVTGKLSQDELLCIANSITTAKKE